MRAWKRILLFLAIFLLMLCAVSFPLRRYIPTWIAAVENSWNGLPYQGASCGADGLICAARTEGDGDLELRFIDLSKQNSLVKWETSLPEEAGEGEMCALYPMDDQCAYLGFYEEDARYLSLYRVRKDEPAERLMREECAGDNAVARRESRAFSSITQQQDEVTLVLLTEDTARVISFGQEYGMKIGREAPRNGALSAVSLPDVLYEGQGTEMKLTFMGNGLFYLDGADMTVHYGDLAADMLTAEVLKLDGFVGEHQLTGISLMQDGSALMLLDGHILLLVDENGVRDLSNQLYPTRNDCIISLLALSAAALILGFVLWWLMTGRFRERLPLVLYWGVVTAALFVLTGALLCFGLLGPRADKESLEQKTILADGAVDLALTQHEIQENTLLDILSSSLETAEKAEISGLRVVQVHREGGNWFLSSGVRAELDPGVHSAFLKQAETQRSASGRTADRFWYCLVQGENGLVVSYLWDGDPGLSGIEKAVLAGLAALAAAVVLILLLIGHDVRETARGLERFAGDQEWKQLRVAGGDELEGMASTLNSMASERREKERMQERITASYRRFVPEQILKLLGKQSVLEVDKNTLVSRRMAVMQVWFAFPDPLYANEANTRLLFDSVNQVIERTGSIVRQKGGSVFDYTCYGYDVIMEQDPRQVISTAVAVRQEILAFNEQRAQDALPTVTLRIAADVGEVIMGIVGDEAQIEPATMSDCFATLQELIGICGRVEASILCTEALVSGMEGYGSRYMGKCRVEQNAVRIYEVFDGDPYDVRKGKEAGVRRFTEGVLSLYSGEIAQAKRVFLELVRDTPRDGGARYYLYLSDRVTGDEVLNGLSLNERMGIDNEKT